MPVLNRIPYFDNRSRSFAIKPLLTEQAPLSKRIWAVGTRYPLDQGSEGACVGFSWAHELAAYPIPHKQITNDFALSLYNLARDHDRKAGNHWPEGASVLAGAKATVELGYVGEYRWAFGIDDVLQTLSQHGPVLLGINWYSSMYQTDKQGRVIVGGDKVGGHAIMAHGVYPNHPRYGDVVIWRNSWGRDYGINGRGYITFEDLDRLLKEDGEACVPTDIIR